jgi:hypothetical protein
MNYESIKIRFFEVKNQGFAYCFFRIVAGITISKYNDKAKPRVTEGRKATVLLLQLERAFRFGSIEGWTAECML